MTRTKAPMVAALRLVVAIAGYASTTQGVSLAGAQTAAATQASPSSAAGTAHRGGPGHTAADAAFMTGMIAHHAQAVLMAGWAPSHGASPAVQALCERIVVGQQDEIALMQRWLGEWHEPVPEADASHDMMPGMGHMLMPGMLTAEQLMQLDRATGPEFDRLFLTFMIRHHQGALTMIAELIGTPGAARDDNVFKLVSDMNADQTIEIERMTTMLAAVPAAGQGP
ncbi:MAG TPA: DUF305 domain-containing protein [Gemmatimonadales bacterium]